MVKRFKATFQSRSGIVKRRLHLNVGVQSVPSRSDHHQLHRGRQGGRPAAGGDLHGMPWGCGEGGGKLKGGCAAVADGHDGQLYGGTVGSAPANCPQYAHDLLAVPAIELNASC